MRKTLLYVILILAISLPLIAADTDDSLPVLKTKVKTLAAFKNGLGFVFKAGETNLKDGWAVMDEIPAAALGTLWIGTTSTAGPVAEVVSFKGKAEREMDAVNIAELLAANVGQEVTILYTVGAASEPKFVQGTILSVPENRNPEDVGAASWDQYNYRPYDNHQGQIVLIRDSGNHIVAINKSAIQSVQMPYGSATLKTKITRDANRAKVRVGGVPKSAEITLAYLEKGITWTPSYLINIADDKQADVTLEAVLANDVEDLDGVDVSFVVGYPNFMFADSTTPLALQQTVAAFVQGLMAPSGTRGAGRFANVVTQSVSYDNRSAPWSPESAYSATQPMPGETNEDLYFYRQNNVTLKKGDRARYTVFTGKVPYEHIYQWNVPDTMNIDERGYGSNSGNQDSSALQVWHALRLENATKQPWTTAPAFAVNGSMPVAQDVLNYTPPGGKSTLKLTVATDVRAEQSQTEFSRKQFNLANYGNAQEVIVNGKLTVRNWKQKPIKMIVKKSIVGEVQEAGQDGKASKIVINLTSLNPTSQIEWEFSLASGETKELTYQYKAIVR